jgi:hypothetical protein
MQMQSAVKAPGTSGKNASTVSGAGMPTPYLNMQQLPPRSIVKPSLRKVLGDGSGSAARGILGTAARLSTSSTSALADTISRTRTPFEALKSPGIMLNILSVS